jgi:hypothetical protein
MNRINKEFFVCLSILNSNAYRPNNKSAYFIVFIIKIMTGIDSSFSYFPINFLTVSTNDLVVEQRMITYYRYISTG